MNNTVFRLRQMLLGWGCVGLLYNSADRWQAPGTVLQPGAIDRLIPFDPSAVWLYLSFFLLIPVAYLACPTERLRWLRTSFQLSALAAGAVFMAWPTTLSYPPNDGNSLSSSLLAALTSIDSAQNCFPSLHMALTVLAVWGLAIAFSIIHLRRHLFIDLVSGTGLGLAVGWLCHRFVKLPTRLEEGAAT